MDDADPEYSHWERVRLPNWGRSQWAALMASGPDSSCANPIYALGPDGDPDGYAADADAAAAPRAPVVVEIRTRQELPPIDEDDAEAVGFLVAQLPRGARMVLCRRYVLHDRIGRAYIEAAIGLLIGTVRANALAVDRIRRLGAP